MDRLTDRPTPIILDLPLPARELSPNLRVHFAVKAPITRKHREAAFFATLRQITGKRDLPTRILQKDVHRMGLPPIRNTGFYLQLARLLTPAGTSVPLVTGYTLTFYLPDARNRDDDNLAAACKAYRDGIADALQMDDSALALAARPVLAIDRKDPRVKITLLP